MSVARLFPFVPPISELLPVGPSRLHSLYLRSEASGNRPCLRLSLSRSIIIRIIQLPLFLLLFSPTPSLPPFQPSLQALVIAVLITESLITSQHPLPVSVSFYPSLMLFHLSLIFLSHLWCPSTVKDKPPHIAVAARDVQDPARAEEPRRNEEGGEDGEGEKRSADARLGSPPKKTPSRGDEMIISEPWRRPGVFSLASRTTGAGQN